MADGFKTRKIPKYLITKSQEPRAFAKHCSEFLRGSPCQGSPDSPGLKFEPLYAVFVIPLLNYVELRSKESLENQLLNFIKCAALCC